MSGSRGGTGTYPVTSTIDGVTELQAGGGIFGDRRYRYEYHIDHEFALTIWTTVISRPNPTRIVVDGGWKAMARLPTDPAPRSFQTSWTRVDRPPWGRLSVSRSRHRSA